METLLTPSHTPAMEDDDFHFAGQRGGSARHEPMVELCNSGDSGTNVVSNCLFGHTAVSTTKEPKGKSGAYLEVDGMFLEKSGSASMSLKKLAERHLAEARNTENLLSNTVYQTMAGIIDNCEVKNPLKAGALPVEEPAQRYCRSTRGFWDIFNEVTGACATRPSSLLDSERTAGGSDNSRTNTAGMSEDGTHSDSVEHQRGISKEKCLLETALSALQSDSDCSPMGKQEHFIYNLLAKLEAEARLNISKKLSGDGCNDGKHNVLSSKLHHAPKTVHEPIKEILSSEMRLPRKMSPPHDEYTDESIKAKLTGFSDATFPPVIHKKKGWRQFAGRRMGSNALRCKEASHSSPPHSDFKLQDTSEAMTPRSLTPEITAAPLKTPSLKPENRSVFLSEQLDQYLEVECSDICVEPPPLRSLEATVATVPFRLPHKAGHSYIRRFEYVQQRQRRLRQQLVETEASRSVTAQLASPGTPSHTFPGCPKQSNTEERDRHCAKRLAVDSINAEAETAPQAWISPTARTSCDRQNASADVNTSNSKVKAGLGATPKREKICTVEAWDVPVRQKCDNLVPSFPGPILALEKIGRTVYRNTACLGQNYITWTCAEAIKESDCTMEWLEQRSLDAGLPKTAITKTRAMIASSALTTQMILNAGTFPFRKMQRRIMTREYQKALLVPEVKVEKSDLNSKPRSLVSDVCSRRKRRVLMRRPGLVDSSTEAEASGEDMDNDVCYEKEDDDFLDSDSDVGIGFNGKDSEDSSIEFRRYTKCNRRRLANVKREDRRRKQMSGSSVAGRRNARSAASTRRSLRLRAIKKKQCSKPVAALKASDDEHGGAVKANAISAEPGVSQVAISITRACRRKLQKETPACSRKSMVVHLQSHCDWSSQRSTVYSYISRHVSEARGSGVFLVAGFLVNIQRCKEGTRDDAGPVDYKMKIYQFSTNSVVRPESTPTQAVAPSAASRPVEHKRTSETEPVLLKLQRKLSGESERWTVVDTTPPPPRSSPDLLPSVAPRAPSKQQRTTAGGGRNAAEASTSPSSPDQVDDADLERRWAEIEDEITEVVVGDTASGDLASENSGGSAECGMVQTRKYPADDEVIVLDSSDDDVIEVFVLDDDD
uniref:Uncharacterized protein LOC116943598 isoform X1 n=1 Tax=Petromyzon marinus TaxID=7757 RepID=A0AAJ7WXM5_PETMA|nr:uncharacterized protein LOC116943598 isoform X1 [Petromyzon marinus]XP_032812469.1 uncharacterized protein LOC116943598 isoform X1 [Petromyzon marinus]